MSFNEVDLEDPENYAQVVKHFRLLDRARQDARRQAASDGWEPPEVTDANKLEIYEPVYLIADYIEAGTVGLMFGPYSSAKSFLAIDMGFCIATRRLWHDHRTCVANVMYIAAEGGRGIGKRKAAWVIKHKELDDEAVLFICRPVPLDNDAAVEWLKKQVCHYKIDFLIIDTIARNKGGLVENDEQDVGHLIDVMYELRDVRGDCMTTVMGLHHVGKDQSRGARGSSRFEGDVDFLLQVLKGADGQPHTLRCKKVKDGEEPPDWPFELEQVEVRKAAGAKPAITSCVVKAADAKTDGRHARRQSSEDQVLQAIRVAGKPLTAEDIEKATSLSHSTVSRVLGDLVAAEQVAKSATRPATYTTEGRS